MAATHTRPLWLLALLLAATGPSAVAEIAGHDDRAQTNLAPQVRLQPGDAIKLTVYPDSIGFPNGVYPIDENGFIDLPLVGYLPTADLDEKLLGELIREAYIEYLPRPNVQVRPLIRATLQGGFRAPGLYWVDPRTSLWSLVRNGGGTIRIDGIGKLRWERDGKAVSRDLTPQYQSGMSLIGMGFVSGDQIAVPARPPHTAWEVFRGEVMPALSVFITTTSSIMTTYLLYRSLRQSQ